MAYAREFHAYYCNYCGNSIDPNSKNHRKPQQKQQPQQSEIEAKYDEILGLDVKYSTTDGIIDEQHSNASIGVRSSISSNSNSRRGCTRAYQFSNKHKTDFERVCAEEDRQMQEKGWQITSDRIDMPHSYNVLDLAREDKKQQPGTNNHLRIRKY